MYFNKFVALTLSIVLLLSLLAGCRNTSNDLSSSNTSDTSSRVYGVVDVIEDETDNTQSTDETTSSENQESTEDNTDTSGENITDNIVSVGDGGDPNNNNADDNLPPTYVESTPESSTPGDDSASNTNEKVTYATYPNYKGKLITADINAGSSVYYKISRVSNKVLTINSPNAYVIYDGVTYTAKDGVLSFFVKTNLLASEQILFEIGNNGSKKESFTIYFTSPEGSRDNPELISKMGEKVSTKLEKDNDQGYFYKYTAEKAGKLKFYLLSSSDDANLIVTNNRNSAQRSSDIEDEFFSDNSGSYVYLDVNSGDEIIIALCTKEKNGVNYPEATIDWMIKYE